MENHFNKPNWTVPNELFHSIANNSEIFDNNINVFRKRERNEIPFIVYCLVFAASSFPLTECHWSETEEIDGNKVTTQRKPDERWTKWKLFKYLLLFGYSTFCHSVAIQIRLAGSLADWLARNRILFDSKWKRRKFEFSTRQKWNRV